MASAAVGIDLGTTNSVVAISQGGRPRVLLGADGSPLIPSVVSFHPNGQTIVGAAARARRVVDPVNTVFSVKRLMGRPFDSEEVRRAKSRFAFEMSEGHDAAILVRTRNGDLSLPEISALVLREIRRVAEAALGEPVERAVVTVPANFNELQRTATKLAGQIADLDVVRILNEPTAAALAYGYGRGTRERIAVYDFGGGTFDVTLLELSGNVFEVLATAGDTFLGGDDIDLLVAENLADGLLQAHRIDARQDRRAYEMLRAAGEQAKIDLSSTDSATVRIPEIGYAAGGRPLEFKTRISRADLERVSAPLVNRTIEVCHEAIKLASLAPQDFQTVILVGGSSRMPLVRAKVTEFFGREPLTTLPPEQVVGMGAAILAEALTAGARKRASNPPAPTPRARIQTLRPGAAAEAPPPGAGTGAQVPRGANPPPLVGTQPSVRPAAATLPSIPPVGETTQDDLFGPRPTSVRPASTPSSGLRGGTQPGPVAPLRGGTNPGLAGAAPPFRSATNPGVAPLRAPSQPGVRRSEPPRARMPSQPPIDELDDPIFAPPRSSPPPPAPFAGARPLDEETTTSLDADALAASLEKDTVTDASEAAVRAAAELRAAPPPKMAAGVRTAVMAAAVPPPPSAFEPDAYERTQIVPQGPGAPGRAPERVSAEMPPAAVVPGRAPQRVSAELPPTLSPALAGSYASTMVAQPGPNPQRSSGFANFGNVNLEHEAPAHAASPMGAVHDPSALGLPPISFPPPARASVPAPQNALPLLLDVTPHTLGIETLGGLCEVVIARNATIPVEQTREFATAYDGQDAVRIRIAQGESRRFAENQALGELELSGITRAARGDVKIAVTFELDADGTLNARAREVATGRETRTKVTLLTMPSAAQAASMAQRQRSQA